jgi:hypothetical protein
VLLTVASQPAVAHVAPDQDTNNRYLKATLLDDRVRLAFTAYFGERPGRALRARLDSDGDGLIAPTEAAVFGEQVRTEVARDLEVRLDGQPFAGWQVADVGLGTPTTRGGTLSVDLRLDLPLDLGPGAARAHELRLHDAWRVPLPGECELRIEASPGVRVVAAHLAREPGGLQLAWAWQGTPVADERRVVITFVREPSAPPPPAAPAAAATATTVTTTAPPPLPPRRPWLWPLLGGALALGAGFAVVTWRRSRRPSR